MMYWFLVTHRILLKRKYFSAYFVYVTTCMNDKNYPMSINYQSAAINDLFSGFFLRKTAENLTKDIIAFNWLFLI